MATPRIPNQRKQYIALNERLARYVLAVQSVYDELNKRAAQLGLQSGYDGEGEFRWSDFPELRGKLEQLQSDFVSNLGALIMSGTSEEWKQSNLLQDMIADKVLKTYTGEKDRKKFTQYYQTNSPQLKAFQQRKDRGLNLSAKLWNQSEDYKSELEDVLSVAIERGTDAVTLSKRVSKYLSDFDAFKSDYTEKFGTATKVHDCEYRSIRLARSEINMAYRTAEQTRWRQFDFVVGYEIKLSGSHPKEDICDRLAGKYPKDFVWTGWHPNDLCYCVPLLKTEDEFFAEDDKPAANEVTDVPPQFKEWCTENMSRIAEAEKHKTLPYFLSDNMLYLRQNTSDNESDIIGKLLKKFGFKDDVNTKGIIVNNVEWSGNAMPPMFMKGGEYAEYVGGDYEFDRMMWYLLPPEQNVKIVLHYGNDIARSCHIGDTIHILMNEENSKFGKIAVIYHEYGHEIDKHRKYYLDKDFLAIYDKYKNIYAVRGMYKGKEISYGEQLDDKLNILRNIVIQSEEETIVKKYGYSRKDVLRMIDKASDTIASMNDVVLGGHSKEYWDKPYNMKKECIAHGFENVFVGNTIMKQFMPDFYEEIVAYIKKI